MITRDIISNLGQQGLQEVLLPHFLAQIFSVNTLISDSICNAVNHPLAQFWIQDYKRCGIVLKIWDGIWQGEKDMKKVYCNWFHQL